MVRVLSSAKAAVWCERLERFEKSGSTVKQFCADESVSVASFYDWRRKLGTEPADADRDRRVPKQSASRVFTPIVVNSLPAPISIRLLSGVQIDVPSENLAAVRAVVGELLRTDRVSGNGPVVC